MSLVVFYEEFGDPDVLRITREDVPAPHAGQVLIANRAVGVNPADVKRLAGRLGARNHLPGVLGFEAAGTVEAVGDGVEGLRVGDDVLWHGAGAQRERALVRADRVRHKPRVIDFEQAAVLPVAAAAAFAALSQLGIGPGDVVLVHGASGGVGSAAVQIAVALGARVIGTTSERNDEYVHYLGARPVHYGPRLTADVRALPGGLAEVTASLDLVGSRETVEATVDLLDGTWGAHMAGASRPRAVTVVGSELSRKHGITDKAEHPGALDEVISLADAGLLHLDITHRFPLRQAADALRLVAGGHVRGKVVLTV